MPARNFRVLVLALVVSSWSFAQEPEVKAKPYPDDKDPVTTESGLRYSILKAGPDGGTKPRMGDVVKVHYTGWLENGTKFDSSRDRGEPTNFPLGRVIEGWNEGLQHMTPGTLAKLVIPSKLGYGEKGAGGQIPPNATLIFEVELLEVLPAPEFHPAKAEAQKSTESGIKWEMLKEGSGDAPKPEDTLVVAWANFGADGKVKDCSAYRGSDLKASLARIRQAPNQGWLAECLALLKPGARCRAEVPTKLAPSQGAPADGFTVWEFELLSIVTPMAIPDFVMPEDKDLKATGTGLKFQVVKEGSGASPKLGQSVVAHYAGWLTDGKLFDSSFGRGEPTTFPLNGVIAGWREGLQLMKEGGVYRFVIPADLAYGKTGSPPTIPADATLVFLVELVKVK